MSLPLSAVATAAARARGYIAPRCGLKRLVMSEHHEASPSPVAGGASSRRRAP